MMMMALRKGYVHLSTSFILFFLKMGVSFLLLMKTANALQGGHLCLDPSINVTKCCPGYEKRGDKCVECRQGYYGSDCTYICPFDYFGRLCGKKCNCPHHFECHHVCGCVNALFINETTAETCNGMTDNTASGNKDSKKNYMVLSLVTISLLLVSLLLCSVLLYCHFYEIKKENAKSHESMHCRDDVHVTLDEEYGRSTIQNDRHDQIYDSCCDSNIRLVVNRKSLNLWNSVPDLVNDENPYGFARIEEASTRSKSASENLDYSNTWSWSRELPHQSNLARENLNRSDTCEM